MNKTPIILFFIAVTGILLLYFYSFSLTPTQINLSELQSLSENKTVLVQAKTEKAIIKQSLILILNDGTSTETAIKINPSFQDIELIKKTKFLEMTARVSTYNGKKQLLIKDMKEWT